MQGKGVVFEGKTLDDAVKKGLEALGLTRAEVMITVLEEGSGGFLGLGARPYKVRMMPRPRRESAEGPPRREREGGRERGDGRRGRGERGGRDRDHERRGPRGGSRVEARGEDRKRPAEAVSRPEAPVARPEEAGGERRRRRDRDRPEGGGERNHARPAEDAPVHRAPSTERRPPRERTEMAPAVIADNGFEGPTMSTDELQNVAREQTQNLLRVMGFEATVTAHAEGTSVEVKAEVPNDSDLLVGPKGEVRQALQHLLNRMVNRSQMSRYHLQLEVNEFWHQREEELQALARSLADEAVTDGQERLTEYLNAQERRIVHVALKEDTRVSTHAIGDGLIKKISIMPAEAAEESKTGE